MITPYLLVCWSRAEAALLLHNTDSEAYWPATRQRQQKLWRKINFYKICRILSVISVLPSYELTVHGVRSDSGTTVYRKLRVNLQQQVWRKISVTMPALHHGFSFGGVETRRSRWSAACEAPGEAWRWFTSSECTHAIPQEDSDSPLLSLICVTKKNKDKWFKILWKCSKLSKLKKKTQQWL